MSLTQNCGAINQRFIVGNEHCSPKLIQCEPLSRVFLSCNKDYGMKVYLRLAGVISFWFSRQPLISSCSQLTPVVNSQGTGTKKFTLLCQVFSCCESQARLCGVARSCQSQDAEIECLSSVSAFLAYSGFVQKPVK